MGEVETHHDYIVLTGSAAAALRARPIRAANPLEAAWEVERRYCETPISVGLAHGIQTRLVQPTGFSLGMPANGSLTDFTFRDY